MTIDRTVPATPAAPALAVASDTDPVGDGITSLISPVLNGVGEPNTIVRLFASGEQVGQTMVGSDGSWEITSEPLKDGNYDFTTTLEDLAGNISQPSDPLALTIAFQYGFIVDPITGCCHLPG